MDSVVEARGLQDSCIDFQSIVAHPQRVSVLYDFLLDATPAECLPAECATLINLDALSSQVRSGQINLLHELCMCLWNVVEGKNTVAKFEKEVGTE